jgi:magnesium-transporting ATPase (P-type)
MLLEDKWHSLTVKEICNLLKTDINDGLNFEEIKYRREKDGPNKISKAKPMNNFYRFLSQFKQPMIYILSIIAFITAFLLLLCIDRGICCSVASMKAR